MFLKKDEGLRQPERYLTMPGIDRHSIKNIDIHDNKLIKLSINILKIDFDKMTNISVNY